MHRVVKTMPSREKRIDDVISICAIGVMEATSEYGDGSDVLSRTKATLPFCIAVSNEIAMICCLLHPARRAKRPPKMKPELDTQRPASSM